MGTPALQPTASNVAKVCTTMHGWFLQSMFAVSAKSDVDVAPRSVQSHIMRAALVGLNNCAFTATRTHDCSMKDYT
jgi:hypothetical protein